MPNWCFTTLYVLGPSHELARLRQGFFSLPTDLNEQCVQLDFQKIAPQPEHLGERWYDWRIQHWARSGSRSACPSMTTTIGW